MINDIRNELGDRIFSLVLFVGFVPEEQLPQLYDSAIGSIALYSKGHPNRDLAEPNRLYQSVARGCPYIVGNNRTMSWFAETYGGGVVLCGDGSDSNSIFRGVEKFFSSLNELRLTSHSNRGSLTWELNEKSFLESVS